MHSAIHVRGRFWYSLYVSKLHGNIYTLTFNLICFLDGKAKLVVRITPKVVIVTKAVILWCDHNNKTYTDLTITMFLLCVCSAIYWQFYLNYLVAFFVKRCTLVADHRPTRFARVVYSTGSPQKWGNVEVARIVQAAPRPRAKMTLNVLYRYRLTTEMGEGEVARIENSPLYQHACPPACQPQARPRRLLNWFIAPAHSQANQ